MDSNIFINRIRIHPLLGRCNVEFRHGLNVIWSQDIVGLDSGEKNLRNSVGKTTFIRFIDYLMGKTYFINALDDEKIKLFNNSFLLAEVILGNCKYTIRRSVLNNEEIIVFNGWIIDDLLSNKQTAEEMKFDLKKYKDFLTDKIYGDNIIINGKAYLTHRNIMSFLVRDQAFGFIKYDTGIKEEGAKERKKRLEFLMGLISQKRELLEREIEELEKGKGNLSKEKNILKKYFELVTEKPQKELNRQKASNEKQIKELETGLAKKDNLLKKLESEKEAFIKEELALLSRASKMEDEIYILKKKYNDYQTALKDIDNELYKISNINLAINLFNPFQFKKCPIYLQELNGEKNICEYISDRENKNEFYSMIDARKKINEYEKKDLNNALRKIEEYIERLKEDKGSLKNSIEEVRNHQNRIHAELKVEFDEIVDRIKELRHENALLEKELSHFEYVNKLKEDIDDTNEKIKEKREVLAKIVENRALDFNLIYDKIIKYITNNTRVGRINLTDYTPSIYYPNGTVDKGSAMGNVAIIAFDLAMLEMSLIFDEVSEVYPKFLVHDSPKFHDMQLEMYERIMDYVIDMEIEYAKQNKEFQYIITTLDISERVIANKEKYIRLTLDNSGDGGKLFGCQVEID